MSFNSFLRIASSSRTLLRTIRSITSVRPYQPPFSVLDVQNSSFGRVVGGQFPTLVRFLTASVDETSKKLTPVENPPFPEEATYCQTCRILFTPDEIPDLPEEAASCQNCKKLLIPVENPPLPEEADGQTSTRDILDELPFEIKDGCPEKGYLTLVRESQDEAIEVKVIRTYEDKDEEDVLKLLEADEATAADTWKDVEQRIGNLYMLVTINHMNGYNKFEKFFVVAWHDEIFIRTMSSRVKEGTKNLEEFEELFSQKVIEPINASDFCSIASKVLESRKKAKLTSSKI